MSSRLFELFLCDVMEGNLRAVRVHHAAGERTGAQVQTNFEVLIILMASSELLDHSAHFYAQMLELTQKCDTNSICYCVNREF